MTLPDDLTRPHWFEDLRQWWTPALPGGLAPHVHPLGLADGHVLRVSCENQAWHATLRLNTPGILANLALTLPDVTITALDPTLNPTLWRFRLSTEIAGATEHYIDDPVVPLEDYTAQDIRDMRIVAAQTPEVVRWDIEEHGEDYARRLYTDRIVDQLLLTDRGEE